MISDTLLIRRESAVKKYRVKYEGFLPEFVNTNMKWNRWIHYCSTAVKFDELYRKFIYEDSITDAVKERILDLMLRDMYGLKYKVCCYRDIKRFTSIPKYYREFRKDEYVPLHLFAWCNHKNAYIGCRCNVPAGEKCYNPSKRNHADCSCTHPRKFPPNNMFYVERSKQPN